MEFYSTIFKTYDMMILDSVFPLLFIYLFLFNAKSTMLQLQSFLSLYVKEFQCLGKVELAGEERVYPK